MARGETERDLALRDEAAAAERNALLERLEHAEKLHEESIDVAADLESPCEARSTARARCQEAAEEPCVDHGIAAATAYCSRLTSKQIVAESQSVAQPAA